MSDYPMLISNKLHSFRNFVSQKNDCIAVILLGDTISMNFSYDGKSKGLDISAKGF